ncbi:MerR family transcriptional regulator [Streptomyces sp. NPDC020403]|uniref:MerR family transcriptional regulator n=1 Tax=unclassified Streptomyces TaxID=2593676 RepID=UPI0033FA68DC
MEGTTDLLSISAFGRRVGLAPSALPFYDDCRVLRPAWVDGATGYRFCSPAQETRAALLRGLREAGLPLADVTVVLGADHSGAVTLPAVCHDDLPRRIGVDPAVLGPALEAGAGPDVLLEISAVDDRPVIVRSADQGSFTTLIMPAALASDFFPLCGGVSASPVPCPP